jgi:hypothetical protein
MPKLTGVSIELGGTVYVVPPLSLNSVRLMQDRIAQFKGGTDAESLDLIMDATHAAIARNYPEITKENLGDWIDLGNMEEVFQAVMDVSGFNRKKQEASRQGELLTNQ